MNTLPPGQESRDEADELYRHASERDPSRPSEATRRAVLAHAERLAAARLTAPPSRPRRARWWPAAFGTLAAGILAALLVVPSRFEPDLHPAPEGKPAAATGERAGKVARAPALLPAESPPAPKLAAAPDDERRAADAQPAPPRSPPALVLREAQRPGAPAHVAPAPAGQSAERADSDTNVAPLQAGTSIQSVVVTGARAAALSAGAAARDSQPEEPADALHRAAADGDVAVLDGLLAQATDLNGRDSAGRTALLVAVLHGRGEAIAWLLAHGADPNAADAAGTTPLAAARSRGDAATAEALRRHGAQ